MKIMTQMFLEMFKTLWILINSIFMLISSYFNILYCFTNTLCTTTANTFTNTTTWQFLFLFDILFRNILMNGSNIANFLLREIFTRLTINSKVFKTDAHLAFEWKYFSYHNILLGLNRNYKCYSQFSWIQS